MARFIDKGTELVQNLYGNANTAELMQRGNAERDISPLRGKFEKNLAQLLAWQQIKAEYEKKGINFNESQLDIEDMEDKLQEELESRTEKIQEDAGFKAIIEGLTGKQMLNMVQKGQEVRGAEKEATWGSVQLFEPDEIAKKVGGRLTQFKERLTSLKEGLKRSTSKSFAGKLKSWFVGNSKEYDKAFRAMEDLTAGKMTKEDAKGAIMAYLEVRKDKVRDHQYGRDRFDGFMKSLQAIMEPDEFMAYCKGVDEARLKIDPNYKGVTTPEAYMPEKSASELHAELQETAAERQLTQRELARLIAVNMLVKDVGGNAETKISPRDFGAQVENLLGGEYFQKWYAQQDPEALRQNIVKDSSYAVNSLYRSMPGAQREREEQQERKELRTQKRAEKQAEQEKQQRENEENRRKQEEFDKKQREQRQKNRESNFKTQLDKYANAKMPEERQQQTLDYLKKHPELRPIAEDFVKQHPQSGLKLPAPEKKAEQQKGEPQNGEPQKPVEPKKNEPQPTL